MGRSLAILLIVVLGLFGLIIWQDWEPKLGLDLRGGTSVILTPNRAKSGDVNSAALDKAVEIISQRVNATGVAEAEVVREGENILVALPDVGRSEALALVGRTAQLRFRKVLQTGPGTPAAVVPPTATPTTKPSATPSASRTPSATPTAQQRPISSALLPQATPTPSPTGSAAPTSRPSASASPAPAQPTTQASLLELFNEIDCAKAEDRERIQNSDAPNQQVVACDADPAGAKYLLDKADVVGTDVAKALATTDQTSSWYVELTMTDAGRPKWAKLTTETVQQQIAIVLDGLVESAPVVQAALLDGQAQITGTFSKREAEDLANVLKFGALPITFDQSQTQEITPTLGEESLRAGLLAGVLGIALVLMYGFVYYRGLGIVTLVGLLIFAALNFAMIVILGNTDVNFTLTLAGIAGLIVSVGISADSYVVFYERLKDEVKEGRSLRAGIDRGWARAFRTIITADLVSLLAAATLYILSVGAVRGFAFTLGLATMIDVAVAYFFTRPAVTLLTRTKLFSEGRFIGITAAMAPQSKEV